MAGEFPGTLTVGALMVVLLVALAVVGMMVMVSAGDLMTLYMGLELQSLSLYVVAAMHRDDARSTEAGLKYFVLGALSSGLLLYGASMVYGYAGTTLVELLVVLALLSIMVIVAAELAKRYPTELTARYKLKSLPAYSANPDAERVESDGPRKVDLMALSGFNGVAILEEIASKRGGLRAGGIIDLHRGAEVLLHELRDGKLGRLTLETPADIPAEPVPEASGETEDGTETREQESE